MSTAYASHRTVTRIVHKREFMYDLDLDNIILLRSRHERIVFEPSINQYLPPTTLKMTKAGKVAKRQPKASEANFAMVAS